MFVILTFWAFRQFGRFDILELSIYLFKVTTGGHDINVAKFTPHSIPIPGTNIFHGVEGFVKKHRNVNNTTNQKMNMFGRRSFRRRFLIEQGFV